MCVCFFQMSNSPVQFDKDLKIVRSISFITTFLKTHLGTQRPAGFVIPTTEVRIKKTYYVLYFMGGGMGGHSKFYFMFELLMGFHHLINSRFFFVNFLNCVVILYITTLRPSTVLELYFFQS